LIAASLVVLAVATVDLNVLIAASWPARYVAIAALNAVTSALGECVFVVGAGVAVSAAIAVPVLAINPAATNRATFFGDMKFISFSLS
jgi:hypothetical protein